MTQVGMMLMDEGRREGIQEGMQKGLQKGDLERAKKTALNMLKKGSAPEYIADILELPAETIKDWGKDKNL